MKVLGAIFSIPVIAGALAWSVSYGVNPSVDKIGEAGQLIVQAAVPWWVSVIQFLATLGTFGAVLVIILLFLVARSRA